MKRRVFSIASLISLLLCLGVLYAFSRSSGNRYEAYVGHLAPEENQSATVYGVRLQHGCAFFAFKSGQSILPDADFHAEAWRDRWPTDGWTSSEGFAVLSYSSSPPGSVYHQLIVPDRYLVMLLALLPTYGMLRLLYFVWRRHRRKPWRCVACDYDLTGNTSGACPECGRKIPGAISNTRTPAIAPDSQTAEIVAAINALANPLPLDAVPKDRT